MLVQQSKQCHEPAIWIDGWNPICDGGWWICFTHVAGLREIGVVQNTEMDVKVQGGAPVCSLNCEISGGKSRPLRGGAPPLKPAHGLDQTIGAAEDPSRRRTPSAATLSQTPTGWTRTCGRNATEARRASKGLEGELAPKLGEMRLAHDCYV